MRKTSFLTRCAEIINLLTIYPIILMVNIPLGFTGVNKISSTNIMCKVYVATALIGNEIFIHGCVSSSSNIYLDAFIGSLQNTIVWLVWLYWVITKYHHRLAGLANGQEKYLAWDFVMTRFYIHFLLYTLSFESKQSGLKSTQKG